MFLHLIYIRSLPFPRKTLSRTSAVSTYQKSCSDVETTNIHSAFCQPRHINSSGERGVLCIVRYDAAVVITIDIINSHNSSDLGGVSRHTVQYTLLFKGLVSQCLNCIPTLTAHYSQQILQGAMEHWH
ncbi:hypothetical protein TNCV_4185991 [Trichonephila clavipes]|nr:hypothetical protein TNCV_4185991 [Trichonephila clavipes]